ncbi:MAG: hypothetical protein ACXABD_09740 [Candidatus Thorarchaeota archaeon]|jgi:hypothetical protein
MATAIAGTSNETQKKELAELKRIKIEQRFARQFYAQFKSLRFGIEACCYEDLESATLNKELCDWKNSSSSKIVVATETPGVFVEPIASVNIIASKSCPTIPSNVCTIVDLANIIAKAGTYSECFEIAADSWVITHNLGRYPSVTVVDNNNKVVVGDIQYNNTNTITISFDKAFVGCAFLN